MLIEALVAILIFSLGVVAVMGLQAVSITQVSQAKYRADASYLANQLIGLMWVADKTTLASFASPGGLRATWDANVASTLPNGSANVVVVGSQATITLNWKTPGDSAVRRYVAIATVSDP